MPANDLRPDGRRTWFCTRMDDAPPTEPEPDEPQRLGGITLTPVSALFPEITEEEARSLDSETLLISARRARVCAMFAGRRTAAQIARECGCSIRTIRNDISAMKAAFTAITKRAMEEHLADALMTLAAREADIYEQWEKSKQDRVETSTGRRTGRSGNETAVVKRKQTTGDPKLFALLIQVFDRRCKLLGLMTKDDLKALGGAGGVKLISGIDPEELV